MKLLEKLSYEKVFKNLFLILTIIGVIYSLNYTFKNLNSPHSINIFLVLPFIFFLTPYLVISLYEIKLIESKMNVIPRFLRDVVDNVDSGMDLISSIINTIGNEYTVLNSDIKKLGNQLSWGIDFETAFLKFADNIGSKTLKRDFLLVIEARKVGGHVEKILRELSQKINNENIRTSERKSNLASNTFTGYISFIIFLFIIILVYNNLFVGISDNMSQNNNNFSQDDNNMNLYLTLLILLSYELALLSGFLFGLMQENNIIAGAPHVVALIVTTFLAFFFFIV